MGNSIDVIRVKSYRRQENLIYFSPSSCLLLSGEEKNRITSWSSGVRWRREIDNPVSHYHSISYLFIKSLWDPDVWFAPGNVCDQLMKWWWSGRIGRETKQVMITTWPDLMFEDLLFSTSFPHFLLLGYHHLFFLFFDMKLLSIIQNVMIIIITLIFSFKNSQKLTRERDIEMTRGTREHQRLKICENPLTLLIDSLLISPGYHHHLMSWQEWASYSWRWNFTLFCTGKWLTQRMSWEIFSSDHRHIR